MSMTVRQADAWDVHPAGRVVILLDPPYGLNKDTWDTKDNARKFYSTRFLKSITSEADAAVVIIYGYDDMLIPLASGVMAHGFPHWRYCNLVTFVPDRPRQGLNMDIHHRLPRNSKALVLHFVSEPLFSEADIVKFCGSGMTAKVCHMLGRDCELSDIDTCWVEATQRRIDSLEGR